MNRTMIKTSKTLCARVYVYLKCNLYVDNTIKYPIIMKFVEEKKKNYLRQISTDKYKHKSIYKTYSIHVAELI